MESNISSSVETRNDLIKFSTEPLAQDMTMVGSIIIKLKVSSDKPDTDFAIRLTDVYPDGKSIIFADGMMRMRFRLGNKQSETSSMLPGKVYDCIIEVPSTALTIKSGHRFRLDVSSSNYSQFNRNMNTGLDMYPGNSLDSLANPVKALNSIHVSAANASSILLPIMGKINGIKTQLNPEKHLTISPNPAARYVKLEWSNSESTKQWKLLNHLGQEISNSRVSQTMDEIDVENLPNGIYYLNVLTNEGVYHQKLIIKH